MNPEEEQKAKDKFEKLIGQVYNEETLTKLKQVTNHTKTLINEIESISKDNEDSDFKDMVLSGVIDDICKLVSVVKITGILEIKKFKILNQSIPASLELASILQAEHKDLVNQVDEDNK